MDLILNIDTATETAIVSIAKNGHVLQEAINLQQKDHATFLHMAIGSICKKAAIDLKQLTAVSVAAGPGSYTGLRVGMASAKGLCFALNIPLIAVGTLEILALQMINETKFLRPDLPVLFCPMIDARRLEVFTALFTNQMKILAKPAALVLDTNSFANFLLTNQIVFSGSGSTKWKQLCTNENAMFVGTISKALYMNQLSYKKYTNKDFENIAYLQPKYVKEFYNPAL